MTAPQPTPDSRVERLATYARKSSEPSVRPGYSAFAAAARKMIDTTEAAGLLVLDPDDEATIQTITNVLAAGWTDETYQFRAVCLLAALRGSR